MPMQDGGMEIFIMDILTIGNSFSCDATHYLHQIARAGGDEINIVNLYIGGCPLSVHYRNMIADDDAYPLEFNGTMTGFKVSLKEALLSRSWNKWDYITLQQVSNRASYFETYSPYIEKLADYIRGLCPESKLLIHQTWAYEEGSDRLTKELGYKKQADMFKDVKESYEKAAKLINADGILPSGAVLQNAINAGIKKIHRDTFHADLGIGRYMLAIAWYQALTGKNALENTFCDFDVPVDSQLIPTAKKAALDAVREYGWKTE
jgi:hypothetical protein